MQELTTADKADYERLVKIVKATFPTALQCAQAVKEIKIRKLYLAKYLSWQEFCNHECGYNRQHLDEVISKMEVVESMCPTSNPVHEQIKSLQVAKPQQNTVRKSAPDILEPQLVIDKQTQAEAKTAGLPAASADSDGPRDETGFRIPVPCLPLWKRRDEVQKLLTCVSTLRTTLRRAAEESDVLWKPCTAVNRQQTWNDMMAALDRAYADIGLAMPYAVCTSCQGYPHVNGSCADCQSRGMVSEFFYKNCTDSKDRKIRETQCRPQRQAHP